MSPLYWYFPVTKWENDKISDSDSGSAVTNYSLQSISHQHQQIPTHPAQLSACLSIKLQITFLGISYKRPDWSKKNFEEMQQQMEEGTKLIQADPDSKTPYSDVTQVSFNFISTFEKPFLTIFPEDNYNNAFK